MKSSRLIALLPLLVMLAGCHSGNTMDTLVPHSDLTDSVMHVYTRIFWWTLLLFVGVQGGLIYIVMRFRAKGDNDPLPEQVHGDPTVEIAWTILPVFILLHIAIPTVQIIFESQAPAGEDAIRVNAVGKQWWFVFDYPGLGVTTANEMHIPLGKEIDVRVQSDNVIHSLWMPQLAGKRDMVPGRVNHMKFTPSKAGEFLGQCAEYCGDSHALMKFRVFVDTLEDFEKWVENNKADAPKTDVSVAGEAAFAQAGCVACHAIRGTAAQQKLGPDLTHVGSRTMIAAGMLDNNTENLKKWIRNSASVKPGSLMLQFPPDKLSDADLDTLVTYLQSLK